MEPILLLVIPFVLLVAWGAGFPIPEESALLLAGALAASLGLHWYAIATCALGIAVSDTLGYIKGRLHAANFAKFGKGKKFIAHAGFFAVVTCRFFVSVRSIMPFMAGALRMSRWRFHTASLLGAVLSSITIVGFSSLIYSLLPQALAPLIWSVILVVVSALLASRAVKAQMALAREQS